MGPQYTWAMSALSFLHPDSLFHDYKNAAGPWYNMLFGPVIVYKFQVYEVTRNGQRKCLCNLCFFLQSENKSVADVLRSPGCVTSHSTWTLLWVGTLPRAKNILADVPWGRNTRRDRITWMWGGRRHVTFICAETEEAGGFQIVHTVLVFCTKYIKWTRWWYVVTDGIFGVPK
jgi:hypothetical protein